VRPCPSIPNLKHAYKQAKTSTSHNSEHNKRFHKKQIPKLLMSFGDGKIQGSIGYMEELSRCGWKEFYRTRKNRADFVLADCVLIIFSA